MNLHHDIGIFPWVQWDIKLAIRVPRVWIPWETAERQAEVLNVGDTHSWVGCNLKVISGKKSAGCCLKVTEGWLTCFQGLRVSHPLGDDIQDFFACHSNCWMSLTLDKTTALALFMRCRWFCGQQRRWTCQWPSRHAAASRTEEQAWRGNDAGHERL